MELSEAAKETLGVKDTFGKTPILTGLEYNLNIDSCTYLLSQGIAAGIGGEYSLGGLFTIPPNELETHVQTRIDQRWDTTIVPALTHIITSMQKHNFPPLLQAAIKANAPTNIIVDIINRFDCTLTIDSSNNIPINTAVEQRLDWHSGMKQLLAATAAKLKHSDLYVAAYYGLQWTNHTKEVVESEENIDDVIIECESKTGMHVIMVAAMGNHNDLDTIYSLLRRYPEVAGTYTSRLGAGKEKEFHTRVSRNS